MIIINEKKVINLKAEEFGSILKEDSWEVLEGGKRGDKLTEFYIRTHSKKYYEICKNQ